MLQAYRRQLLFGATIFLVASCAPLTNAKPPHKIQSSPGLSPSEVAKVFNAYGYIQNKQLIQVLEISQKDELVDETGKLLWDLWYNSKYTNSSKPQLFKRFDYFIRRIEKFAEMFEIQMKWRSNDFSFVLKTLEYFDRLSPSAKTEFVGKLQTSGATGITLEFFNRFKALTRGLHWFKRLSVVLIPHLKASNQRFLDSAGKSLIWYNRLDEPSKTLAKKFETTRSSTECYKQWRANSSSEAVALVQYMDSEIGTDSCLWKINLDLSTTTALHRNQPYSEEYKDLRVQDSRRMSDYWMKTPVLLHELWISAIEESEKNQLIDRVGESVLDVWNILEKKSTADIGTQFLRWTKTWITKIEEFSFKFSAIVTGFHGFDSTVLIPLASDFFNMTSSKKTSFLDSLEYVYDFESIHFAALRTLKRLAPLKHASKWIHRIDDALVRHISTSPQSVWVTIGDYLKIFASSDPEMKTKIEGVLTSDSNCKTALGALAKEEKFVVEKVISLIGKKC